MIRTLLLIGALATATNAAAEERKWWPSKWGADDTLGSFNMLGPELTMKAVKLVKTGKTYRLGIETNRDTPTPKGWTPRSFDITVLLPNQDGVSLGDNHFNFYDDRMDGWMGIGSQVDGLGHAGTDGVYYNGFKGKDFATAGGLRKMGVEAYPPIVSRGVLLDMAACMGQDMLKEGTAINRAELMACEKKQGVTIEKGDVVLLHTGWLSIIASDPKRFITVEPGLGIDGAKYLAEKEIVAVGVDNWAIEVMPCENPNDAFPVHQELLNYNGIYQFENMNTSELAKDKAYEFMFVLGPARITGAVQMIINPIAIR
ncbi:MAG: cyclase family protein [Gammaproteobacteria bacterium]|nr:cyclase family protein [Gammaproteobacteria bacterium]